MNALISEIVKYVVKFLAMIICAGAGIFVGKTIRKNKSNAENANQQ